MSAPTPSQIKATREVVRWYLDTHYQRSSDPGVLSMFFDEARVGAFAVDEVRLRAGDGDELFRLLVATAMFQRLRDTLVQKILRGISPRDASELTTPKKLLGLVDAGPCSNTSTLSLLLGACDLTKDAVTRQGACTANAGAACHLKRHTVLLKRYGHFGKMPTSLALLLRELDAVSLADLYATVLANEPEPTARAMALEAALSRAWRVNQKIASMFLSAVTNAEMAGGPVPWQDGVDSTYFVVIDTNVDLFLATIGYAGYGTYDARRAFVRALAARIDLRDFRSDLSACNPRLVQQAMYLFMSAANRREAAGDCMRAGQVACAACPSPLRRRCPVRGAAHAQPAATTPPS